VSPPDKVTRGDGEGEPDQKPHDKFNRKRSGVAGWLHMVELVQWGRVERPSLLEARAGIIPTAIRYPVRSGGMTEDFTLGYVVGICATCLAD
jgi:hypothetical protein